MKLLRGSWILVFTPCPMADGRAKGYLCAHTRWDDVCAGARRRKTLGGNEDQIRRFTGRARTADPSGDQTHRRGWARADDVPPAVVSGWSGRRCQAPSGPTDRVSPLFSVQDPRAFGVQKRVVG
jgi:hypothetical protein